MGSYKTMDCLHIVMITDSASTGGAGIAASRLAAGLRRRGHAVTRIMPRAEGAGGVGLQPEYAKSLAFRASARAARLLSPFGWDEHWSRLWLRQHLTTLRPDIINVHNLHGAGWPSSFLRECTEAAPTVWTLHDCWSFTGRCVYPGECEKYVSGCDATCPSPDEYPALPPSKIATALKQKRELIGRADRLVGVTPSQWLKTMVEERTWKGRRVEAIANGLPLDVYQPEHREQHRRELGLGPEPVLLATAQNLDDPRKGMRLLTEALKSYHGPEMTVLTFGGGTITGLPGSIRVRSLGTLDSDAAKVRAYNAADVYAHPALEDNLPNSIAESIACGTPVAALPVGGVPEMVHEELTGWLAGRADASEMAATLTRALDARGFNRAVCRRFAEAEYNLDRQAGRYESLFWELRQPKTVNDFRVKQELNHS